MPSSKSKRGTCSCKRPRPRTRIQRTWLMTTIAAMLLLTASTAACTSPMPLLNSLHLHLPLPRSTTPTSSLLLHRRSPSPAPAPAPTPQSGIVLANPEDAAVVSADGSSSSTTSSALPSGYTFPQPFDAVLGVNFTSTSCPAFFNRFLADPAFKACAPLSLLLETSTSFFKVMQDSTVLPAVLDQICAVDSNSCVAVMDQYAFQIDQTSTCGPDLRQGNALATSALNGFRNYELYHRAGCLKDPDTNQYCFAEAANATSPNDLFIYYLPGGTSLPSGEKPTCDTCSQSVMSTFSNYATNATMRISETYTNARNVIALSCGPSFAPMVAATVTAGAGQTIALSSLTVMLTIIAPLFLAVTH